MARDKERAINPATAQRRAEKQKALRKGKAALAAQRTERLAARNPQRLQTQIDALRERQTATGNLPARDRKILEDLEQELSRVRKAKETVGKRPSKHGQGPAPPADSHALHSSRDVTLGKRGRGQNFRYSSESSETEDDVKMIPMPCDTPPPTPARKSLDRKHHFAATTRSNNPNHALTNSERVPAQTIYESKPVLRDLRKEATGFLPSSVRRQVLSSKNQSSGKQFEPGETNALEKEPEKLTRGSVSGAPQGFHNLGGSTRMVHHEEVEDAGD